MLKDFRVPERSKRKGLLIAGLIFGVALIITLFGPPADPEAIKKIRAAPAAGAQIMVTTVENKPHPSCGFQDNGRPQPGVFYCTSFASFFGVMRHCNFIRCVVEP